jgi:integrase
VPLHVRKRGEVWYARGVVRVGSQAIEVAEYSTGCRTRSDAEAQAAAREASIRADLLAGPEGKARKQTVADAILAYLQRPGGVPAYDVDRLADLNERIGDRPISDVAGAWHRWLVTRGAEMAPGTAARWRAILQAALGHWAKAHGVQSPRLPTVKQKHEERIVFLSLEQTKCLLSSYTPSARPVALVLAYQGMRTQEALRLEWRNVDWGRNELRIPGERTKTGRGRTVPMHPQVRETLEAIWLQLGRPQDGPVFLSARGEPYQDTRGKGGNPIKRAHATACKRAGISGFRVHDWRHSWAANMVMAGVDLPTLMRLGGWRTMAMVARYASVTTEHMAEAIARLK